MSRLAGVNHTLAINRSRQPSEYVVVRAEEEMIDVESTIIVTIAELAREVLDVAVDLRPDGFGAARVVLEKVAAVGFDQAILLLNRQQASHAVNDDEVDLTIDRGAPFDPCPVHAVIDRELIAQHRFEKIEGRQFIGRRASCSCRIDFVGDQTCHRESVRKGSTRQ